VSSIRRQDLRDGSAARDKTDDGADRDAQAADARLAPPDVGVERDSRESVHEGVPSPHCLITGALGNRRSVSKMSPRAGSSPEEPRGRRRTSENTGFSGLRLIQQSDRAVKRAAVRCARLRHPTLSMPRELEPTPRSRVGRDPAVRHCPGCACCAPGATPGTRAGGLQIITGIEIRSLLPDGILRLIATDYARSNTTQQSTLGLLRVMWGGRRSRVWPSRAIGRIMATVPSACVNRSLYGCPAVGPLEPACSRRHGAALRVDICTFIADAA
jgi:hypothetical protein